MFLRLVAVLQTFKQLFLRIVDMKFSMTDTDNSSKIRNNVI